MKNLYVAGALAVLLATAVNANPEASKATDAAKPAEKSAAAEPKKEEKKAEVAPASKSAETAKPAEHKKEEKKADDKDAKHEEHKATTDSADKPVKPAHVGHKGKPKRGPCPDMDSLNGNTAVWHMPTAEDLAKTNECAKVCHKGGKKKAHSAAKADENAPKAEGDKKAHQNAEQQEEENNA